MMPGGTRAEREEERPWGDLGEEISRQREGQVPRPGGGSGTAGAAAQTPGWQVRMSLP